MDESLQKNYNFVDHEPSKVIQQPSENPQKSLKIKKIILALVISVFCLFLLVVGLFLFGWSLGGGNALASIHKVIEVEQIPGLKTLSKPPELLVAVSLFKDYPKDADYTSNVSLDLSNLDQILFYEIPDSNIFAKWKSDFETERNQLTLGLSMDGTTPIGKINDIQLSSILDTESKSIYITPNKNLIDLFEDNISQIGLSSEGEESLKEFVQELREKSIRLPIDELLGLYNNQPTQTNIEDYTKQTNLIYEYARKLKLNEEAQKLLQSLKIEYLPREEFNGVKSVVVRVSTDDDIFLDKMYDATVSLIGKIILHKDDSVKLVCEVMNDKVYDQEAYDRWANDLGKRVEVPSLPDFTTNNRESCLRATIWNFDKTFLEYATNKDRYLSNIKKGFDEAKSFANTSMTLLFYIDPVSGTLLNIATDTKSILSESGIKINTHIDSNNVQENNIALPSSIIDFEDFRKKIESISQSDQPDWNVLGVFEEWGR